MHIEELEKLFGIVKEDYERIRKLGKIVAPEIDRHVELFYQYLEDVLGPDFDVHFPDKETLANGQAASRRAWLEFFEANWDEEYILGRQVIGKVHAQLQVEPLLYLAGMNKAVDIWVDDIYKEGIDAKEWPEVISSMRRVADMEGALVVDVYSQRTGEVIAQQSRAMIDMSTPIAALWDGVLMLPIVGLVDSRRAEDIMQRMLEKIAEKQATMFILDISGVAVVDTAVANHLIRMTRAAQLMGCDTIVSGLSPSVARTIVELGINIGDMKTTGNLQDAVRLSFNKLGVRETSE